MVSKANQEIVNAIDSRIGSFNALYVLSAATIMIMILLGILGFFSVNSTNKILQEFVSEVKLNSKEREVNALMAQNIRDLTNSVQNLENRLGVFIVAQEKTNESVKEFNSKHAIVLDAAGNYINQNPIELLRKGM